MGMGGALRRGEFSAALQSWKMNSWLKGFVCVCIKCVYINIVILILTHTTLSIVKYCGYFFCCSPTLWSPSFGVGEGSFALLEANSVFNRLFSLVGWSISKLYLAFPVQSILRLLRNIEQIILRKTQKARKK